MNLERELASIRKRIDDLEYLRAKMPTRMDSVGTGGGARSSGEESYHYVRGSVAEFPEASTVAVGAMARVNNTEDPNHGKMYVVNVSRTAWVCFTHWS